jgi:beta-N-acetylhexosaminidase
MLPMTKDQTQWVNETLASLTLEQRIAQLSIPQLGGYEDADRIYRLMGDIPLGAIFVSGAPAETHRRMIDKFQQASRVPLVVAADLECGAGYIVHGAVPFPDPLAIAAADSEALAYTLGHAAAVQGREVGIHWTYAPVVDVNLNPDNPIANTRSLGDDPERIARLAAAIVRGMQDHGLAACAKHFPGDGIDDMDQHVVTTVNALPMKKWNRVSGRAFRAAFEAGALSVMIGHIALPAWDRAVDRRGALCPASVNRKLVTGLLRKKMKFGGLVVTDDMNMGGVAGYQDRRTRTVACIHAGCDMLLFPKLPDDYHTLVEAAQSGRLSRRRIDQAARAVLEFKARLNLHRGELRGPAPSAGDLRAFEEASRRMARSAIAKVRDWGRVLPLNGRLKPGAKVLTITLSTENMELPEVDRDLRARGYDVHHLLNPNRWDLFEVTPQYAAVFVNFLYKAAWAVQTVRSVGPQNRIFLGGFFNEHPCAVFTSFGSPYHLRMFNTLPNLVNVHSASPDSQRSAVAAWFGEIPMTAKSPVGNLTRPAWRAR